MVKKISLWAVILIILSAASSLFASSATSQATLDFPLPLAAYQDSNITSIGEILSHRIQIEPLNLVVSLIFLFAIIHTFMAGKIMQIAHRLKHEQEQKNAQRSQTINYVGDVEEERHIFAELLHFLGEIEAIFGLWVLILGAVITYYHGWGSAVDYLDSVSFIEPLFVVVIMTLASTRPIMQFAEQSLRVVAKLGKESNAAWWLVILTVGPLLGSFITEPAAMTISALLLSKQFYDKKPNPIFAYATIGLLFVNISVGGTLSHFAAPPVLMVANAWQWDLSFMLFNFGWKAFLGILIANSLYFFAFKKEFKKLDTLVTEQNEPDEIHWDHRDVKVPGWVTLVHILFMAWTVATAHHPPLFIGGFLFFIGFSQATAHHQNRLDLKPALLVGFFLAGLIIHGGMQSWWIAPILSSLSEWPLMIGATVMTAFNDNAAITYLSTLVPDFTPTMKYAVVAGAVTGGGLTVIANAPNPAGQSILQHYFKDGVNPLYLAMAALLPTLIMGACFMFLK